MLNEEILKYNSETLKVIINDEELDFNVVAFLETKTKYAEYLNFTYSCGGYMFFSKIEGISSKMYIFCHKGYTSISLV